MDNTILVCCEDLERSLHDNKDKNALLTKCAKDKMMTVYKNENIEFDNLLGVLERSIDYNSYVDVKKCVTKLLRLLTSNRKVLIKSLRRIY